MHYLISDLISFHGSLLHSDHKVDRELADWVLAELSFSSFHVNLFYRKVFKGAAFAALSFRTTAGRQHASGHVVAKFFPDFTV
jgi:hypothetical protein